MPNQAVLFIVTLTFILLVVQGSLVQPKSEGPAQLSKVRLDPPEQASEPPRDNGHRSQTPNGIHNDYYPVLEEVHSTYAKRVPAGRRVCGKQLTALLSLVCNGRYNTGAKGRKRRSAPTVDERGNPGSASGNGNQQERKIYPEENSANEAAGSGEAFLSKRANAIFLQRRQDEGDEETTGAYSECCLKPCAVKDMIGYCHPDVQKSKYGVGG